MPTTLTERALAADLMPRQGTVVGELLIDLLTEPDSFAPVPAEVERIAMPWAIFNLVGPEIVSDPVARRAFFESLNPWLRFRLDPHLDHRTLARPTAPPALVKL